MIIEMGNFNGYLCKKKTHIANKKFVFVKIFEKVEVGEFKKKNQ